MNNPFEEIQAQLNRMESTIQRLLLQQQATAKPLKKNEEPITIERAAELLDLSVNTIYKNQAIPRHKRHNKLRFFESEILEYIKNTDKKSAVTPEPYIPRKRRTKG